MPSLEEAMAEAVALSDEILIEPINDILFVNPEERKIEIPETELLLGVYSDRNVERKYFKCPRIIGDNIDLSLCYMFINYVSSSGTIGQQQCNDVKLDETGNYITFSWLLSGNVFDKNIDSKVYFSVQAKMPNGENVFNTRKVSGDVYETVEAGEEITEEYADVILQIISRIDEIEQGGGVTQEQIEQALNKYLETNPIEVPTKLSELENDSGYVKTTDIPDKLPNPQKLTFAGAVTAEYDGFGAVTVTIPSAVTDDHINNLINIALGVIENGTY